MLMIYCNKTYVYPQAVSATCADKIFAQASLNSEVFKLVIEVMEMYRKGELKDQGT